MHSSIYQDIFALMNNINKRKKNWSILISTKWHVHHVKTHISLKNLRILILVLTGHVYK